MARDKAVQDHIDKRVEDFRKVLEECSDKIESLKEKERLPVVAYAKELTEKLGITDNLYHVLRHFLKGYPGIVVRAGAHGGVEKLFNTTTEEKKNK